MMSRSSPGGRLSIGAVTKKIDVDNRISLRYYIRVAETILKQLLDIYWKNEHRLMCTGEVCTASERDRYEKAIYKSQRNAVLCVSACLLYWSIYRLCKYHRDIDALEAAEKRHKEQ